MHSWEILGSFLGHKPMASMWNQSMTLYPVKLLISNWARIYIESISMWQMMRPGVNLTHLHYSLSCYSIVSNSILGLFHWVPVNNICGTRGSFKVINKINHKYCGPLFTKETASYGNGNLIINLTRFIMGIATAKRMCLQMKTRWKQPWHTAAISITLTRISHSK